MQIEGVSLDVQPKVRGTLWIWMCWGLRCLHVSTYMAWNVECKHFLHWATFDPSSCPFMSHPLPTSTPSTLLITACHCHPSAHLQRPMIFRPAARGSSGEGRPGRYDGSGGEGRPGRYDGSGSAGGPARGGGRDDRGGFRSGRSAGGAPAGRGECRVPGSVGWQGCVFSVPGGKMKTPVRGAT